MKLKKFNNLNESNHDFLSQYRDEIQNAIKLLTKLHDYEDVDYDKIEDKLSVYDTNVAEKIDRWIYNIPSAQEIADFATRNQERWGTEPQMILQAIDDYAQVCGIYTGMDDDDEDEDYVEENENVEVDNFTSRYYDNFDDEDDPNFVVDFQNVDEKDLKRIQMFEQFLKNNY